MREKPYRENRQLAKTEGAIPLLHFPNTPTPHPVADFVEALHHKKPRKGEIKYFYS